MPGEGWAIFLLWADEEAGGRPQFTASILPAPLVKPLAAQLCIGSRLVEGRFHLNRIPRTAVYAAIRFGLKPILVS